MRKKKKKKRRRRRRALSLTLLPGFLYCKQGIG